MSDLHELLEPLAAFVGTFVGEGRGVYPTIEGFSYREELTLSAIPGKPVLRVLQRTNILDDGRTSHSETGFWRVNPHGLELVLAHTTGHVEVATGELVNGEVSFVSARIDPTPTAKSVTATERRYRLAGDELVTEMSMAAVEQPMQGHLRSVLARTG